MTISSTRAADLGDSAPAAGLAQRHRPAARSALPAALRRLSDVPLTVWVSFAVLLVVLAWSLAPALFASASPTYSSTDEVLLPPSAAHWFGTDHLGRDLFARVVYGTATSVQSALIAVAIGVFVGGAFGLFAGYLRRWVDVVLGRFVDVLLAIPSFLLAVVIVSALGFQTINAAIATGVSAVAVFARVMRAEVLKTRGAAFVEASELAGGGSWHVLFRHVLPNAWRPVLTLAVLQFGLSILIIAGLAFLGYGDPPPASDWGLLIASGKEYPTSSWLVIAPSAVIVATVLSINRVSRWLRKTH